MSIPQQAGTLRCSAGNRDPVAGPTTGAVRVSDGFRIAPQRRPSGAPRCLGGTSGARRRAGARRLPAVVSVQAARHAHSWRLRDVLEVGLADLRAPSTALGAYVRRSLQSRVLRRSQRLTPGDRWMRRFACPQARPPSGRAHRRSTTEPLGRQPAVVDRLPDPHEDRANPDDREEPWLLQS